MGLNDTIRAGNVATLERGRQEGRNAIASAEQEYLNRREELVKLLGRYHDAIKAMDNAIKEWKARLLQTQNDLKAAQQNYNAAVARLSSCKRGSAEERTVASEVAKYAADVNMYQAQCKRIFAKLQEYTDKREELKKGYDSVAEQIRRLDEEGQNIRGARDRFQEDRIQAIIDHQKTY